MRRLFVHLAVTLLTFSYSLTSSAAQLVLIPAAGDHEKLLEKLLATFPSDRLSIASVPPQGEQLAALATRYLNSNEAKVVLVAWMDLVDDGTIIRLQWRSAVENGSHSLEVENKESASDLLAKRLANAYFQTLDRLIENGGTSSATTPSPLQPPPTSPTRSASLTEPTSPPSPVQTSARSQARDGSSWTTHVFSGVNANYDQSFKIRAVPHFGFQAAVHSGSLQTRFGMGVHIGIPSTVRIKSNKLSSAERGAFALLGFGGIFGQFEIGTHLEVRGSEFSVESKDAGSSGRQAAPIVTPYAGATLAYALTESLKVRVLAGAEYLPSRPWILANGTEIARPSAVRPEISLRLLLRFGK